MSAGFIEADVGGLYATGGRIAGRSSTATSASSSLKTGVDAMSSSAGHALVKGSVTKFVTSSLVQNCNKLGTQVSAAGKNVKNVSATLRNEDEEGARTMRAEQTKTSATSLYINARVPTAI